MAQTRGDEQTIDLLRDWTPPEIVQQYNEERVRTASLRARIARAVSETLKDAEDSREEIAAAMAAWLGEEVTKGVLDAYASEAKDGHTIPYIRLLALVQVTGDVRLLQLGADLFGHVVAEKRYLHWIRVGMEYDRGNQARQVAEDAIKEAEVALRLAKRGARP